MNSREKVMGMRQRLLALKPPDEESAQMLQLLVSVSPLLMKAMPEDPDQLDHFLKQLALGALYCRGDEAVAMEVHSWDGERWQNESPRAEVAG